MSWTNVWVYGLRTALESWLDSHRNAEGKLPHDLFVVGPCYPQEQSGVDAFGNPRYVRRAGSVKCLWLFSLNGTSKDLLNQVKVLNGPYVIYENASLDEIKALYPSHCLGQGIPHIARISP